MTARREEVWTASGGKADEEEGGLSPALLYSHADSDRPIGANGLQSWTQAGSLLSVVTEELGRRQKKKH